jgi:hypothetical protein
MRPDRMVASQPCRDRVEVSTLDDTAPNPRYRDWFGRYIRLAANPFIVRRLAEMNAGIDLGRCLAASRPPAWWWCGPGSLAVGGQ